MFSFYNLRPECPMSSSTKASLSIKLAPPFSWLYWGPWFTFRQRSGEWQSIAYRAEEDKSPDFVWHCNCCKNARNGATPVPGPIIINGCSLFFGNLITPFSTQSGTASPAWTDDQLGIFESRDWYSSLIRNISLQEGSLHCIWHDESKWCTGIRKAWPGSKHENKKTMHVLKHSRAMSWAHMETDIVWHASLCFSFSITIWNDVTT